MTDMTPTLPVKTPVRIDDWKPGKTYNKDDVVYLEGNTFVSLADGNGNTPSTTAQDWKLQ